MYAIQKKMLLFSAIVVPMILLGTNSLQRADNSAMAADGASVQTVPHRVDMQMLASAFR